MPKHQTFKYKRNGNNLLPSHIVKGFISSQNNHNSNNNKMLIQKQNMAIMNDTLPMIINRPGSHILWDSTE